MTFSSAVSPLYKPDALQGPGDAERGQLVRPDLVAAAAEDTSPSSGRMKPHRTLSSVVLPAPFGPMTPMTCRGGTASDTASSAVSPPNRTRHVADLKH